MPAAPALLSIRRTSRLSGAALLAIAQAVLIAFGYITHILIGKIGGPPLYGVYGVVLSLQSILNMLLTLGIPVATSKEVAEDERNSGGILRSAAFGQLSLAVLLSAATVVLARPAALLLGDASLTPIIRFTAVIYPFTGLYALLTNYFNGLHAFAIQAGLIVLYSLVKLGGSMGLLFPYGVRGALAGFGFGGAVAATVGYLLARRTIRGRLRHPVPVRRLLTFAGAFVGTSVALQILMSTDLFLVKRILHDDTLAGYYNAAVTLARIPYFILQAFGFVFLPSVARLMHENPEQARVFIRDVFRYLTLLLLPVTAVAAATSKGLLRLFFSYEYEPAAQPLTLLMIALGLLSAFYLLATIAAGAGKPRVPLVIAWLLVPLSVAAGFVLIPRLALEGAAIATILAASVGALGIGSYMYWRFRITFPLRTLLKGVLATVITVTPTYFVQVPTPFLPLLYVVLGVLYALALVAFGEVRKDDLTRIRSLLPRGKLRSGDAPLLS